MPQFEALVPQGIPTDGPAREALVALRKSARSLSLPSDPDAGQGWCGLDAVGDVLSVMSQTLLPEVTRIVGTVLSVVAEAGGWLVRYDTGPDCHVEELRVESVVISTGCVAVPAPRELLPRQWAQSPDAPPVRVIPLEEALQAGRLREHLHAASGGGVGVIGGGHSGVVLVRALLGLELGLVPCVRLFIRRPIQLAQWSGGGRYGAWGFRGLKGAAAELAVKTGLVGAEPANGPVSDADGRLELWTWRR